VNCDPHGTQRYTISRSEGMCVPCVATVPQSGHAARSGDSDMRIRRSTLAASLLFTDGILFHRHVAQLAA